jgi:uncharacterized protein (TIGR00297 family)
MHEKYKFGTSYPASFVSSYYVQSYYLFAIYHFCRYGLCYTGKKIDRFSFFYRRGTGVRYFYGFRFTGLAMMTAFFILGSVATSWQRHKKQAFVSAKENRTGRSALQVFANAGVSAIAGFVMIGYPELSNLVLPVMAAAFASATADTLSSELGMLYGRQFFNIITLTADRCGMDGVVSLEGTLIGVVGSCVIAVVYALGFGWNMNFIFIVLGGTVGNLTDSLLGALLERKGWIGNTW